MFRARYVAKQAEQQARQNFLSFLLRNGILYSGTRPWTKMHWNWLHTVHLEHPVQQRTLQEYIDAILQCQSRITRIDGMLQQAVDGWHHESLVRCCVACRF